MDGTHHLAEDGGAGVAAGHDLLVVLIARPHSAGVIRGVAHEVAIPVAVGRTGLTGNVHTAELRLVARADQCHLLQQLIDNSSRGVLYGHIGLRLVLQNDIAVGILHADEGARLGVDALVDEGSEGRRHFLGRHALFKAAQCHIAHLLRVRIGQILEAKLVHQEVIGAAHAVGHVCPHRTGIQGLCQCRVQCRQAAIPPVEVSWPHIAVEQHGVVVDNACPVDSAVIQCRRVGGQGLYGGSALPCVDRPVPAAIHHLLARAADHRHHIAVGGIDHGQRDLQLILHLLTGGVGVAAGVGDVVQIVADLLGDLLVLGILRGVDLISLAVHHIDGLIVGGDGLALAVHLFGDAQLLHQSLCHIGDHGIGEPRVAALDGGGALLLIGRGIARSVCGIGVGVGDGAVAAHILAGDGIAVGKLDVLCDGCIVLLLRDLALIEHLT